ncbi:MAG: deoxyribonuclease V [Dehalococcoidia bacterium]|nr:deoxyribonuclease V [Dehalococcoidia bacterium]
MPAAPALAGQQLHRWDVSPAEARAIQNELSSRVGRHTDLADIRLVAGADVHPLGSRSSGRSGEMVGVVSVLSYPELTLVETAHATVPAKFPYIPGLLSFRETPAVLAAMARLTRPPDLLLVDGQGLAHPRRFGLACHLGVLLDVPTIGCAKSILVGNHGPLAAERGARASLIHKGDTVGAAVRTRSRVQPVYVSVGHRVDLEAAVTWALQCTSRYRIPEPLRQAHLTARHARATQQ